MKKLKAFFLMLCLCCTTGYCASTLINISDGAPINVIKTGDHTGIDRTTCIIASIDGHTLTVIFTQNLGDVTIEVSNEAGFPIDLDLIGTPNGYQCYIPLAGHYTVVFKFDNGDEYSGEFDVTN